MPQGPNDPTAAAGFAGKNLRVLESGFSSMAALGTRFDFCFFQMGVFPALEGSMHGKECDSCDCCGDEAVPPPAWLSAS